MSHYAKPISRGLLRSPFVAIEVEVSLRHCLPTVAQRKKADEHILERRDNIDVDAHSVSKGKYALSYLLCKVQGNTGLRFQQAEA